MSAARAVRCPSQGAGGAADLAPPKVLVIDDLSDARWVLCTLVRLAGYTPLTATSAEEALETFRREAPDIVLLDVCMPDMSGFDVLNRVKAHDHTVPVIMLTAHGKTCDAVRAIRSGAFDYVTRPFINEELLLTLKRALEDRAFRTPTRAVSENTPQPSCLTELMGHSTAVQRIVAEIEHVGPTTFPVLVTGETGTGKELIARAVHAASLRANKPFVVVDCGAIAESLLESELFGHEKGAYTGAHVAKAGAFELAAGGTIFLDEIGNMPLQTQSTLLRVLETRRIHRVGGIHEQQIDFRVVAATNVDLRTAVDRQTFRLDLYHRLAGFTVRLPALRERRADVPFLVNRFLTEANRELGRHVTELSTGAWRLIERYEWPGNIRELRNCIRRAVLMCSAADGTITPECLVGLGDDGVPACSTAQASSNPAGELPDSEHGLSYRALADLLADGRSLAQMIGSATAELERAILVHVLKQTHGNQAQAARQLCIDYKTMQTKLRKYGLTRAGPRAADMQSNVAH